MSAKRKSAEDEAVDGDAMLTKNKKRSCRDTGALARPRRKTKCQYKTGKRNSQR
jgi:hypothetical protein